MLKTFFVDLFESAISNIKKYNYSALNIRLIVFVLILTILGINVIGSASKFNYDVSQTQGLVVGLVVMVVVGLLNYKFVLRFYWIFYILNLLVLLAIKFTPLGNEVGGAKRWIVIGGFQFQPSELSKIILILFFAAFLAKYKDKLKDIKFVLVAIALFAAPALLIYKQPDLSTTIVIFLTFCAIIFICGLSYKIIGIFLAIIVPLAIVLLCVILALPRENNIIEKYQYDRIIGFYDEENSEAARIRYQQENSVMAIGSGGLTGKGLNNDETTSVKNGNYISEPQTDFIFTIVGEELGFIGTTAVIVLIALIVFECMMTGLRASTLEGKIICIGFGSWIAFQSFINIAVATMLIPNTGLPLPFVSYGQTSLVCLFIGVGLVLNVSLQREKIRFGRR
ncbi:MAG: FtsW/RodA/SpoVE family cell cycle protein [Lachnospiraceae bacterium]|nr:FtsW/RodA/SpoVE family cell cycle protein [Lachnospiraceae bacterium]